MFPQLVFCCLMWHFSTDTDIARGTSRSARLTQAFLYWHVIHGVVCRFIWFMAFVSTDIIHAFMYWSQCPWHLSMVFVFWHSVKLVWPHLVTCTFPSWSSHCYYSLDHDLKQSSLPPSCYPPVDSPVTQPPCPLERGQNRFSAMDKKCGGGGGIRSVSEATAPHHVVQSGCRMCEF